MGAISMMARLVLSPFKAKAEGLRIAADPIPGRTREDAELAVACLPESVKHEALIQYLLRVED